MMTEVKHSHICDLIFLCNKDDLIIIIRSDCQTPRSYICTYCRLRQRKHLSHEQIWFDDDWSKINPSLSSMALLFFKKNSQIRKWIDEFSTFRLWQASPDEEESESEKLNIGNGNSESEDQTMAKGEHWWILKLWQAGPGEKESEKLNIVMEMVKVKIKQRQRESIDELKTFVSRSGWRRKGKTEQWFHKKRRWQWRRTKRALMIFQPWEFSKQIRVERTAPISSAPYVINIISLGFYHIASI